MSTLTQTLKNEAGDIIIPRTKSNAVTDNNGVTVTTRLDNLDSEVSTIKEKIPTEASSSNKLVDTTTAENTYQKILTPGDGITIVNNTVSAPVLASATSTNGIGWIEHNTSSTYSWSGDISTIPTQDIIRFNENVNAVRLANNIDDVTKFVGGTAVFHLDRQSGSRETTEQIVRISHIEEYNIDEIYISDPSEESFAFYANQDVTVGELLVGKGLWVLQAPAEYGCMYIKSLTTVGNIAHKIDSSYISSGSQDVDKVLMSDGEGGVSWEDLPEINIKNGDGFESLVANGITDEKAAYGHASTASGISVSNVSEKITDFTNDTAIINTWQNLGDNKFTLAKGEASTAEGSNNLALGKNSHAEGNGTLAQGNSAHSEGTGSQAVANYTHAGGLESVASGLYSFTHGKENESSGDSSVTLGRDLTASGDSQIVVGRNNIEIADSSEDKNNAQFIVGNGGSSSSSNAFVVYKDGHAKVSSKSNTQDTPLTLDTKHNNSYLEFQSNGNNLGYIGFLNDKTPVVYTNGVGDQKIVLANKTTGDVTVSGKLTVGSDPTNNMDAATKQYVDSEVAKTGKYLGTWNWDTGKPSVDPETLPYTYVAGDCYDATGTQTYQHTVNVQSIAASSSSVNGIILNYIPTAFSTSEEFAIWLFDHGYNYYNQLSLTGTWGGNPATRLYSFKDNVWKFCISSNDGTREVYTYYRVTEVNVTDTVSPATQIVKYKPSGTQYTGSASTEIETSFIAVGDTYLFNGSTWTLKSNTGHIEDVILNGTSAVEGTKVYLKTIDNLTSSGDKNPLTANQGKLLNDKVTLLVPLTGTTAPSLTGQYIGQMYINTSSGDPYFWVSKPLSETNTNLVTASSGWYNNASGTISSASITGTKSYRFADCNRWYGTTSYTQIGASLSIPIDEGGSYYIATSLIDDKSSTTFQQTAQISWTDASGISRNILIDNNYSQLQFIGTTIKGGTNVSIGWYGYKSGSSSVTYNLYSQFIVIKMPENYSSSVTYYNIAPEGQYTFTGSTNCWVKVATTS